MGENRTTDQPGRTAAARIQVPRGAAMRSTSLGPKPDPRAAPDGQGLTAPLAVADRSRRDEGRPACPAARVPLACGASNKGLR